MKKIHVFFMSALSKIVTRIRVENWFRSVGTDPKSIQNYKFVKNKYQIMK